MRYLCKILLFLFIVNCPFTIVSYTYAATPKPVKYKTVLSEAKTAIKEGKKQADAEKKLLALLGREDINAARTAEIYYMAEELERSQNEKENMKLYLRQPYDTIKLFSTILRMHQYVLACDSVESIPNAKGEVKYRYRTKGRDVLLTYRSNLLNGGKFLLKRNKYAEAYPYFDMYLQTAYKPIFEFYSTLRNDTLRPRAAYWATISAYNANQPKEALKYIDEAIGGADASLRVSLQEYKVRCYEQLGDKEKWMDTMLEGNRLYPEHDYFFLHLMDVYTEGEMYDEGLQLCERMLSEVGERGIYWYGESQMYLAKQDYDACIITASKAIAYDSTLVDAYYNKGMAFLNKAVLFSETVCNDIRNPKCKRDRQALMQLYRQAQAPMEQVRNFSPEDTKRWALPLYRIYLNLNMGKEFAEMEKILNAQ